MENETMGKKRPSESKTRKAQSTEERREANRLRMRRVREQEAVTKTLRALRIERDPDAVTGPEGIVTSDHVEVQGQDGLFYEVATLLKRKVQPRVEGGLLYVAVGGVRTAVAVEYVEKLNDPEARRIIVEAAPIVASPRPKQARLGSEAAPVGPLIEPPDVEGEEVTVTRVKRRARYFKAAMTVEACIGLLQGSRDSRLLTVGKAMSVKNQRETYIPEGAYEQDREKLLRAFIDHGELVRHRALHGPKPLPMEAA